MCFLLQKQSRNFKIKHFSAKRYYYSRFYNKHRSPEFEEILKNESRKNLFTKFHHYFNLLKHIRDLDIYSTIQGRIQDLSEVGARFISEQKNPDLGTK